MRSAIRTNGSNWPSDKRSAVPETVIQVAYEGRTGNRLFQFALASVLGRMAGLPFYAKPIAGFPGTEGFWPPPGPLTRTARMPREFHAGMRLQDLAEVAWKDGLMIRGWPHAAAYYQPHREWLSALLAPECGPYIAASEDDLVLHLRMGDYLHEKNVGRFGYPLESVFKLLAQLSYDRCLMVTDSPAHPAIRRLARELRGQPATSGNAMSDYRTLYHAPRAVITPSTFGWWATWTGAAKEIYIAQQMGVWTSSSTRNALPPADARYRAFDGEGRLQAVSGA